MQLQQRLLMRPEYNETKAETETKNNETETSLVNLIAHESKTDQYALLSITYLK